MFRGMNAVFVTSEQSNKFSKWIEELLRGASGKKGDGLERVCRDDPEKANQPEVKEWRWLELTGEFRVKWNTIPVSSSHPGGDYKIEITFYNQLSALTWAIQFFRQFGELNIGYVGVDGYGNKDLHVLLSEVSDCYLGGPHLNDLKPSKVLPVLEMVESEVVPLIQGLHAQADRIAQSLAEAFPLKRQKFILKSARSLMAGLISTPR